VGVHDLLERADFSGIGDAHPVARHAALDQAHLGSGEVRGEGEFDGGGEVGDLVGVDVLA
jgi:hypothetical protein